MNTNDISNINLNIGDQLTLNSCGRVVVEIIKFIAYQRLQIPYTYQWLKQLINSRLEQKNIKESYQSERHFHTASTALKSLDFILKSLLKEIGSAIMPEEICIVLGATPYTCKEIYRFIMPTLCHKPQCQSAQIATDQKLQRHVFKTLATSEQLGKVLFNTLSPTNMYVFIKRKITSNPDGIVCSDDFVLVRGYKIPKNCKIVNVNFGGKTSLNVQCCNNFKIFGDISTNFNNLNLKEHSEDFNEIESSDTVKWFQSTYVMKGFKDCVVNGSSVTNTWTKSI